MVDKMPEILLLTSICQWRVGCDNVMAIVIVKLLDLGTGVLIEQILSVDLHKRHGR